MPLKYMHPRNILVETLQRLYDYGMTTTSGGNLSVKDEEGNIWITPSGIDQGALKVEDIVKVTPAGEIIGRHRPSCELPFHRSVYKLRKDVRAVLHAHSPALVAFSVANRLPNANLLPSVAKLCGKVSFAKYEIPGSLELGDVVAGEFAKGSDAVIMENHGAVMCGNSISQAFAKFEALDYIARIEINATSFKQEPKNMVGRDKKVNYQEFTPEFISARECELRDELVNFRARCYRKKLLFSGSAFLSSRLNDDDFLVTPADFDPMYLDAYGMVRMFEGKREVGKTPAISTPLIRTIYNKCPWINSVILTRPPHVMAFAVTNNSINSRTIPESYIMMRDVPTISSMDFHLNPEVVIEKLTPSNPVVLIESYGILTTGKSVLEAYDRLEVSEFTAKCIIMSNRLGEVKTISENQVEDIIAEFQLPKE